MMKLPTYTAMVFTVEIDEAVVMQLVSMGFDIQGCKRAVYNTNNQGGKAF